MSKGLEALKSIEANYLPVFKGRENGKSQFIHDCKTIEKELKALEIIKPFLKNIRLEENEKGKYEVLIDVINSDKPLVIARFNSKEQFYLLKEILL